MRSFYLILKGIIYKFYPRALSNYGWFGCYNNWEEAKKKCTGYNSEEILDKVKVALLKVKNGEAAYERDSVTFNKIEFSFPLLTCLMWVAAQNKGCLNIIDFGGSLGSTYFQNISFLSTLDKVQWNVVEQPSFVEVGKQHFEDENLKFFYAIKECLDQDQIVKPNVILLSSVLQYLENPYELVEVINNLRFDFVLVDRTLFITNDEERLTIQKVPPYIYNASYPAWFFDKSKLIDSLSKTYKLLLEFGSTIKGEQIALIDNKPLGKIEGFLLSKK